MTSQIERANLLNNLHIKGDPLILFNIWDAGSAKVLQEVGAKAIATGSWSVASAHGFDDGEKLPFDLALANLKRIIDSVDLPVTMDLEGGYGQSPAEVQDRVARVLEAGAVGINFEDQVVGVDSLYSIEDQCARIQAIREAAKQVSIPLFINARTDIFLKAAVPDHSEIHMQDAITRATAYAGAGASGFFAPGLRNSDSIQELCQRCPIPVNIMILPEVPSNKQLASLGVARISYGNRPFMVAMKVLKEAAGKALSGD